MGYEHRVNGGKPKRRYPWQDLKQLYVEGKVDDKGERTYPTYREIAELFELSEVRIRERGAQERWVDERAAFQAQMEKVRQEKKIALAVKEAIAIDEKALGVSKIGVQLVQARLGEIAQEMAKRAQLKRSYDQAKERGASQEELDQIDFDPWAPPAVDAREVSTLAQAATAWHTLALKSLGEAPTARLEITGADGAPVQIDQRVSIREELQRDDPARLHALLVAIERAQIAGALPSADPGAGDGDDPGGADVAALPGGA